MEMAIDNLIYGFVATIKDQKNSQYPLDIYKFLLDKRKEYGAQENNKSNTTSAEAKKSLDAAIKEMNDPKHDATENIKFFELIWDVTDINGTAGLVNMRNKILGQIKNYSMSEDAQLMANNFMGVVNGLAKAYNDRAQKPSNKKAQSPSPSFNKSSGGRLFKMDISKLGEGKKFELPNKPMPKAA